MKLSKRWAPLAALGAAVLVAGRRAVAATGRAPLAGGWVPCVVDVAHHQSSERFDWAAAMADGLRGVLHKLSEGASMRDCKAQAVRRKCDELGLAFGGYHFVLPVYRASAARQARNAVAAAAACGLRPGARIWLDWGRTADWTDADGRRRAGEVPPWEDVRAVAREIRAVGYRVGLYASVGLLTAKRAVWDGDTERAFGEDGALWAAQWGPRLVVPSTWAGRAIVWQHAGGKGGGYGRTPGMGLVDRDAVRPEAAVSREALHAVLA